MNRPQAKPASCWRPLGSSVFQRRQNGACSPGAGTTSPGSAKSLDILLLAFSLSKGLDFKQEPFDAGGLCGGCQI